MTLPRITISGLRLYRLSSGGASQVHMVVELANEDDTQKQRLWWLETVPGRYRTTLDTALLDNNLKAKVLGSNKWAGGGSPITFYTVADNKTTVKTLVPDHVTTQIGIAKGGQSEFMVRFNPDKGGTFMIRFVGSSPAELAAKPLMGKTIHWTPKTLPHAVPSD